MTPKTIARRRFLEADQVAFAALSGDCNPMHMDPVAARRTQAGAPVVHGIHMLLWSLDAAAAADAGLPIIAGLKARFDKMVYVGDPVDAVLTKLDEAGAQLELQVNGITTGQIVASFAPSAAKPAAIETSGDAILPAAPIELTVDEADGRSGRVGFASTPERAAEVFPAIAKLMGAGWVRSVLATTTLVGMICPGLHSIFGGLTVNAAVEDDSTSLSFRVSRVHSKFRVVRMDVAGPGLTGTIESFVRHPPTAQAAIADLAPLVRRGEFAGTTALVIGGSRGLGELTAKLLAAGGAHVIATYTAGIAEAQALAEAIRSWGGRCDILPYDVTKPADSQLGALPGAPTHLYYFATPGIFRTKAQLFIAERFAEFETFYVSAFYDAFMTLRAGAGDRLSAFYPSSIAVESRPADMTEYTMAKAAGEVLCADIQAFVPGSHIVINRLPRLPTDQTATLLPTEAADPVAVMLPIIREVQAGRAEQAA